MHALEARQAWTQLLIVSGALIAALAAGCAGGQPITAESEFTPHRPGLEKRKARVTLTGLDLSDLAELKTAPQAGAFRQVRVSVDLCEADGRCSRTAYEVQYGRSHRSIEFKPVEVPGTVWAGDLEFLVAEADSDPALVRETLTGLLRLELTETRTRLKLAIRGNLVLARARDSRGGRMAELQMTDDTGEIPVHWETSVAKPRLEEAYNRIPRAQPRR